MNSMRTPTPNTPCHVPTDSQIKKHHLYENPLFPQIHKSKRITLREKQTQEIHKHSRKQQQCRKLTSACKFDMQWRKHVTLFAFKSLI